MSTFIPPAPPASSTPPALMVPVAYGAGAEETAAARGSYGPVIGMLAVVVVLAAAALAVGRLCFGRRALGHPGARDVEAWVERTCGPCVGGVITRPAAGGGGGAAKEQEEEGAVVNTDPVAATEERGAASGGAAS